MKTTRWPRRRSTSPMPTQLLVGPKAPSGKKTMVEPLPLTGQRMIEAPASRATDLR